MFIMNYESEIGWLTHSLPRISILLDCLVLTYLLLSRNCRNLFRKHRTTASDPERLMVSHVSDISTAAFIRGDQYVPVSEDLWCLDLRLMLLDKLSRLNQSWGIDPEIWPTSTDGIYPEGVIIHSFSSSIGRGFPNQILSRYFLTLLRRKPGFWASISLWPDSQHLCICRIRWSTQPERQEEESRTSTSRWHQEKRMRYEK